MSIGKVLLSRDELADHKQTLAMYHKRLKDLSGGESPHPLYSKVCQGKQTGDADEIQRQARIIREQIDDYDSIIRNCILYYPASKAEYVGPGVVVEIQRFDAVTSKPIGAPEIYEIGGYRTTDIKRNPMKLSYDAPIASAIRSLEIGELSSVVTIAGREIYVEVRDIWLPNQKQRDEPELQFPVNG